MSFAGSGSRLDRAVIAVAILMTTTAVVADETATADPPAGDPPVAAAGGADGSAVEEIIVTARRRAENAQDVPVPITTIGGSELDQAGQFRLEDLNQRLPSTNVQFNNPRQTSVAVRGLGNNPANDALESSVGIYLDGVYLGRASMGNLDLVDINQIALLSGPQGTLFGKNTTAGVLNVSTKLPTFRPEAEAEASYGNLGYFQVRASASDALIGDTLAGRLTIARTYRQGFVEDLSNGNDYDGTSRYSARGQLLWKPTDTFSLRVIGDYNNENSETGASVLYSLGPNGGAKYLGAVAAAGAKIVVDPNYESTTIDGVQNMQVITTGGSVEANWHFGSGYTLTSITAFRRWFFHPQNDGDGTNLDVLTNAGQRVRDQQWTQELRIASPDDRAWSPWSYVAGLYFFNEIQHNDFYTHYGPDGVGIADLRYGTASFANGLAADNQYLSTVSGAAFGQLTWRPVLGWEFTAGLRDTNEKKQVHVEQYTSDSTAPAFLATYPTRGTGGLSRSDNDISALLSASYKFTPDIMAYASVSRGAKSGAINPALPPAGQPLSVLFVAPEVATDGEVGIKSTLLERRLVVNANLFLTHVQNYQASELIPPTTGSTFQQVLANVGGVRTEGLESEISFVPVQGLDLRLAASYNEAVYTDYHNAPCSAEALYAAGNLNPGQNGFTCNLTGKTLVGAPRWILNPGVQYSHTYENGLTGVAQADYSWRSSFFGSADDSVYALVPSYGLLNVRYGINGGSEAHTWGVSVWSKNVLNKRYVLGGLATSGALYTYSETPGDPRTYGVTVRVTL